MNVHRGTCERCQKNRLLEGSVCDSCREWKEADPVTGYKLWRWPEFIALCNRLGIVSGSPTTELTIHISVDNVVKFDQHYQGVDINSDKYRTN